jgi:hypothetical protein
MSYLIPFNASKLESNGFNNTFIHQLDSQASNFRNAEIAIHSISMFNSVFNIDSAYGNNTVQIKMPTGSTTSTISITFPDGIYSYSDMSRFIQSQLKAAGAYLINGDGLDVHYIQISENATYYSAQVDLSPVPTSLPSGWSRPATGLYSVGGLPTTTRVPILNILNEAFGNLVGLLLGEYPATSQTTLQSILSNITPTIHPVAAYMLRCNLITNKYVIPRDVLDSFDNQGTEAGQLISYRPNEHAWVPIPDGSYSNIRLTIVDQDERFIKIRDNQIQIILAIRERA